MLEIATKPWKHWAPCKDKSGGIARRPLSAWYHQEACRRRVGLYVHALLLAQRTAREDLPALLNGAVHVRRK